MDGDGIPSISVSRGTDGIEASVILVPRGIGTSISYIDDNGRQCELTITFIPTKNHMPDFSYSERFDLVECFAKTNSGVGTRVPQRYYGFPNYTARDRDWAHYAVATFMGAIASAVAGSGGDLTRIREMIKVF